jgi:hypothetical protein
MELPLPAGVLVPYLGDRSCRMTRVEGRNEHNFSDEQHKTHTFYLLTEKVSYHLFVCMCVYIYVGLKNSTLIDSLESPYGFELRESHWYFCLSVD